MEFYMDNIKKLSNFLLSTTGEVGIFICLWEDYLVLIKKITLAPYIVLEFIFETKSNDLCFIIVNGVLIPVKTTF